MKRLGTAFLIALQLVSFVVLTPVASAEEYPNLSEYSSLQTRLPQVMTSIQVSVLQQITTATNQAGASREALQNAESQVDALITHFDTKAKELLPELSELAIRKTIFDQMVLESEGQSKEDCVAGTIYRFESYKYCFDNDSHLSSFINHLNSYGTRRPVQPINKDFLILLNLLTDLSHTWSLLDARVKADNSTPSPVAANILSVQASETGLPFTDVPADFWAKMYIETLWQRHIVKGRSDTSFAPGASITRAELLKMVILANNISVDTQTGSTFTDVPASHGLASFVAYAAEHGWVRGQDNMFFPDRPVTRFEAVKIILNAFAITLAESTHSEFSDVADGEQAQFVETARARGVVNGYNSTTFAPNNLINRAEGAKIIASLLQ